MVKEEESYAAVERNTSGSRPKELFLVRLCWSLNLAPLSLGWSATE